MRCCCDHSCCYVDPSLFPLRVRYRVQRFDCPSCSTMRYFLRWWRYLTIPVHLQPDRCDGRWLVLVVVVIRRCCIPRLVRVNGVHSTVIWCDVTLFFGYDRRLLSTFDCCLHCWYSCSVVPRYSWLCVMCDRQSVVGIRINLAYGADATCWRVIYLTIHCCHCYHSFGDLLLASYRCCLYSFTLLWWRRGDGDIRVTHLYIQYVAVWSRYYLVGWYLHSFPFSRWLGICGDRRCICWCWAERGQVGVTCCEIDLFLLLVIVVVRVKSVLIAYVVVDVTLFYLLTFVVLFICWKVVADAVHDALQTTLTFYV